MKISTVGPALLLAFGGTLAAAQAQSTTAVMLVSAKVANVCTYAPFSVGESTNPPVTPDPVGAPYNQIDVNGKTYTQPYTADLGTYKANASSAAVTRNLYIHRCTSFTSFAPATTSGTVTLNSAANENASNTARTLNATWTLDTLGSVNDQSGVGDVHYGNVTFTIPAGQWNAAAGTYSGNLSVLINYN